MMSEGGFINDELKKELEQIIEDAKLSWHTEGIEMGIEKIKINFDEPLVIKEQCKMCRDNQHDHCLIYKTFIFKQLNYDCNCSCISTDNFRQRLSIALEELEKERAKNCEINR